MLSTRPLKGQAVIAKLSRPSFTALSSDIFCTKLLAMPHPGSAGRSPPPPVVPLPVVLIVLVVLAVAVALLAPLAAVLVLLLVAVRPVVPLVLFVVVIFVVVTAAVAIVGLGGSITASNCLFYFDIFRKIIKIFVPAYQQQINKYTYLIL